MGYQVRAFDDLKTSFHQEATTFIGHHRLSKEIKDGDIVPAVQKLPANRLGQVRLLQLAMEDLSRQVDSAADNRLEVAAKNARIFSGLLYLAERSISTYIKSELQEGLNRVMGITTTNTLDPATMVELVSDAMSYMEKHLFAEKNQLKEEHLFIEVDKSEAEYKTSKLWVEGSKIIQKGQEEVHHIAQKTRDEIIVKRAAAHKPKPASGVMGYFFKATALEDKKKTAANEDTTESDEETSSESSSLG